MKTKKKILKKNQSKKKISLQRIESNLFFLTILFIPTQLGKHFWPAQAFIYSLKIDYLSPTIYLWDLILLALIFSWLIKKPPVNLKAAVLLGIFLVSQALPVPLALNQLAILVRLEQLFLVGLLALYIASQDFNQIKSIIRNALGLAVAFEGFLAVLEFMTSKSLGFWFLGERSFDLNTLSIATFNWYGQVFLRPYATFPHPNVMGAFMVISLAIIFFLDKTRDPKRTFSDLPIKGALLLGSAAALLSFSRGVILILFLESLFYFRKKLKLLLVFVLILLPVIFIRFNSALNFDSLSVTRREELADVAFNQFIAHPIFGVGLNNFINQIATQDYVSGPSRFLQPVHNIFLLSLAETGIAGYLGFLIFLSHPLWLLRKTNNINNIKFIIFIFTTVIFLGMFDHYFLTLPQGQRLLFLVWGLSLSIISSTIIKDG